MIKNSCIKFYHLGSSDGCRHIHYYIHGVSADDSFVLLQAFLVEPLLDPRGVDFSNPVKHKRVEMFNISKYSS